MVFERSIINTADQWLLTIPQEQRSQPSITLFVDDAWNTFTPNQIVQEVRAGSSAGEQFIQRILGISLEMSRR